MKTRKLNQIITMLFAVVLFTTINLNAQHNHDHSKMKNQMQMQTQDKEDANAKTITIKVSTVQCGMCKKRIEKGLSKIEGIHSSNVDYKKKTITVKYAPEKITPKKIRKAISDIGYQADNMKADKKAYNKLPSCCKVPGDK